jgi:cytochrome c peroxidase
MIREVCMGGIGFFAVACASNLPMGAARQVDSGLWPDVRAEDGGAASDAASADPDPTLTQDELSVLATLSPAVLPGSPPDPSNAHADDSRAAALGQKLFFTTIFAGPLLDGDNDGSPTTLGRKGETGKVGCKSCHLPDHDFNDVRSPSAQISLAAGWGRRRAPSLLDIGQAKIIMWDGRRDALYNQVFGPIESVVEMNSSRLYVAQQIFRYFKADYEGVFGSLPPLDDTTRFPVVTAAATGCLPAGQTPAQTCDGTWHGYPGDHAEFDSMARADQDAVTRVVIDVGKAIGAYERLLRCGPSPFDAWMHGDRGALSRSERRGAQIFVGPGRCSVCHSGPFLSDQAFHNVGLTPMPVASAFIDSDDHGAAVGIAQALSDPLNTKRSFSDGDDGRLPATVTPALEGSFRTPTLRCVARRPSFFHTGQAQSLAAVVDFFDAGGNVGGYYGKKELAALNLTPLQKSDLVAFLRALSGSGAALTLITMPP